MQTVIGLFESAQEAQNAAQQLMNSGFSSGDVDVSIRSDNSSATGGSTAGTTSSDFNATSDGSYSSLAGTTDTDMDRNSDRHSDRSPDSYTDRNTTSGTSGEFGSASPFDSGNISGNTVLNTSYDDDASRRRSNSGDSYDNDHDGDSFGDKVSRFFKNLFGGDDDEADRYSRVANKTGSMVTVTASTKDEAERAADILDEYGAVDVDKHGDMDDHSGASYAGTGSSGSYSGTSGLTGSDYLKGSGSMDETGDLTTERSDYSSDLAKETSGTRSGLTGDYDEGDKINVIREDVEFGKKEVQTGGVRLRSRIVERPVEQQMNLKEERVTVERNPVDRPATTADFKNFREGDIEMTEYAEVPDVSKQARVVEEVRISKEVNERTETLRETAQDTEVDVEKISSNENKGNNNTSTANTTTSNSSI